MASNKKTPSTDGAGSILSSMSGPSDSTAPHSLGADNDVTRTLLLWLPPLAAFDGEIEARPAWLRVDDGVIVDSGQDDGWVDAWERPQDDASDDRLIALAPAVDVPLRWLHYPDAAPAQAAAAARLDALKGSLGDAAALHVVAGQPADAGQAD